MHSWALISVICILALVSRGSLTLPTSTDASAGVDNETLRNLEANFNDTPKNLYVVKAVVYEIGILTEGDENDTSFESHERVDLTFFDAHTNESHIDLGTVPLPIQTNVSGQILTGIAPVNIGAFSSPTELLSTLPLTGTIVNITHSNTAFYKLTASNASSMENWPQVITDEDLKQISETAGIFPGASATQEQQKELEKGADSLQNREYDEHIDGGN